jgi:uncharacterized membrane protein HdeD (DUF308 family)
MRQLFASSWWILVLRGIAAILFGVLALAWPGITLLVIVALFAAYVLVTGMVALVGAIRNRDQRGWWLVLLLGIVSLAAGFVAIFYPEITALAIMIVIGASAFLSGVLDIAMAIRLRREIRGEWLLGLAGVLSIVFGVLAVIFPGAGALALIWLVSVYAMAIGVLFIILGFKLRSAERAPLQTKKATAS